MDIDILGIVLAKRVLQLHGADRRGHALHGSKVTCAELLGTVRKLQPRVIAMEACSSSLGTAIPGNRHRGATYSPQYVAPFVKTNKNDANDAGCDRRSGEPAHDALRYSEAGRAAGYRLLFGLELDDKYAIEFTAAVTDATAEPQSSETLCKALRCLDSSACLDGARPSVIACMKVAHL
jgi:transposase